MSASYPLPTGEIAGEIAGQTWQWRGHNIYYVHTLSSHPDRPPLLLLHGFRASTNHWRKNMAQLQKHFQVWAIDLLGFGASDKPDCQYSNNLWRDQLHDFIQEVIGAPVVLVGNSLGGYLALCVAAQRPESAVGLVSINSAGLFTPAEPQPEPPPYRQALNRAKKWLFWQDWFTFLIFQLARQRSVTRKSLEQLYLDKSAVTDRLVEEFYRPSCDPGSARIFALVFKTPSNEKVDVLGDGEKVDVLLSQLRKPLLTLWGEADPLMNVRERGASFRQYYPELKEYYLQAGHCPHDEIPDRVNELIRSWVLSSFC